MNANYCTITVYASGTTEIADYAHVMDRASNLRFATGYPGGLYLDCTFYVSRDLADWWALKGAQRVVVRNGVGQVVYEGFIDSFDYTASEGSQGIQVNCVGAWSKLFMQRRTLKFWSDTRTDEKTWKWNNDCSLELWQVDRSDRIRISAKGGCSYTSSTADDAEIIYTAPTGVEIKRVTYDYNFNEFAGREFTMATEEWNGATWGTLASVNSTGTGSSDLTCAASCTKIKLHYYANAASADTDLVADEKNFGSWSKLCLYTETGTIDLSAVVTDVRGLISEINTTDYYVNAMGAASLSLCGASTEPSSFGAFDAETFADVLMRAASFGDASYNRWSVGFKHSELAPSQDGKPVIYCEQYPALTDYDFSVRLDDQNLLAPITIKQNFGGIFNYIFLKYTDDNGNMYYLTPDDDANLKDATSITNYGQRDYLLDVGNASATLAKNNAYRFLTAYKDPQFTLTAPVQVVDTIRTKSGLFGPTSQVRAGFRLRVENFIDDLTGTGTGATFLISSTDYDDTSGVVTITAGPPEGLIYPVYNPWQLPDNEWVGMDNQTREAIAAPDTGPDRWTPDMVAPGSGGGGGGGNPDKIRATVIGLNKKGKPWKSRG